MPSFSPLPLSMGEGEGGGGQKAIRSPLPSIPSHQREGRFPEEYVFSIMDSLVTELLQHDKREKIEVKRNCRYKRLMEQYLADRSALFNEGSTSRALTLANEWVVRSPTSISPSAWRILSLSVWSPVKGQRSFPREMSKLGLIPFIKTNLGSARSL